MSKSGKGDNAERRPYDTCTAEAEGIYGTDQRWTQDLHPPPLTICSGCTFLPNDPEEGVLFQNYFLFYCYEYFLDFQNMYL